MHDTFPLVRASACPRPPRRGLATRQVNLGDPGSQTWRPWPGQRQPPADRGADPMKKLGLLLIVALIVAFFAFDLDRFLTLEALKAGQTTFAAGYEASPWRVAGAYLLLYVAVTALSLPGAAVMTLAGGALFGLWVGTLAGVLRLQPWRHPGLPRSSRWLLRDWVQGRYGERLAAVNAGMAKDGAFYLFTLRLVPVFPFFVINLLMGLTPIKTRTFYWVSQLGMLAGTLVYVNAGTQLARLDSLSGILSPGLVASFALLGVFPLAGQTAGRPGPGAPALRRPGPSPGASTATWW
jgi:uncharacterized membrane protein YdjX (TVP38/TMEM64 family)